MSRVSSRCRCLMRRNDVAKCVRSFVAERGNAKQISSIYELKLKNNFICDWVQWLHLAILGVCSKHRPEHYCVSCPTPANHSTLYPFSSVNLVCPHYNESGVVRMSARYSGMLSLTLICFCFCFFFNEVSIVLSSWKRVVLERWVWGNKKKS